MTKTLIVKGIDRELYRKFKAKCAEKGQAIKDMIPQLMKRFVEESNDNPQI